jgi:coniferyl-aldehyde dehydrogenase
MRGSRVGTGLRLVGLDLRINSTPKGVVGIIGPWNFPIQLVIAPAAAALAAGNRVMIRPSSVTARTTAVLAAKAPEYFDLEELAIVTPTHGGGSDFSKLRFDHLFFTGSPRVGESVAVEAAKNLVPVTLELGGKNPAIVDRETDVALAAKRLALTRLINGGQVCLCPDYVFVPREHADEFVKTVVRTWKDSFPAIIENPDFTSIVNNTNYDRIVGYIANAVSLGATKHQFVPAGEALPDRATRKIPPTLLTGVTSAMAIENEEVFGPVLTVYAYDDVDEAIAHINGGDHPLTMYWYGDRNVRFDRLVQSTTSGSINGNDFGPNMASGLVPFGGIGRSGMGNYHGEWGFDTFTHKRAIAYSRLRFSGAQFMAPPYKRLNKVISTALLRRFARARRLRERNQVS